MNIAIVGRGCVLPGALDPEALWHLVLAGEDATGPVPEGRWRVPTAEVLTSDPTDVTDRALSDRGGYVHGFDARFDPHGFAIDGVEELDPIVRWTLHASRQALREAGIEGPRERAGVILGNLSFPSAAHAAMVERHWLGGPSIDPRERFHSSTPAVLTARALELRGAPSFCLDAACASSLYAIALACEALSDGRADLMLAGAVNCTDDLFIHIGFSALGALSPSGRSRPFHPDADGLVPAEGAAIVALMRLEDALAEGRHVLGVIRAVGLANDGRAKNFLAPSQEGQVRAMRAAYRASGLSPRDIGWIECHATGTPLGDATELESTAQVFAGCEDVPIGSLKANLGHLITAAGAAGLLKVLAAMEAGVRPPTPHLDGPLEALKGTPLRVVTVPEPWEQQIRRAAISAFGFGGNDAHLIVEAWTPERVVSTPSVSAAPMPAEPIAIVALGLRVGPYGSAAAFADAWNTGVGGRRAEEVVLPLERLRTPPADLHAALAQQTMLLSAALDACPGDLDRERTGVLIGMQCDSEVGRYGLRWRHGGGATSGEKQLGRTAGVARPLSAAGVLGTMPNIPANRINRELDLRGPSYTVSADELSGVRALEIAMRALRTGELDAAVVGAVDLACEPVHEAAARELLPPELHRGGDAAVVLVLERLSDARAKERPVLAILDEQADGAELVLGPRVPGGSLAPRFGHAHAASGLLHVAAAALALHRRARLGEPPGAWEAHGGRQARVEVEALFGERAVVTLREDVRTPEGAVDLTSRAPRHPLVLPAHPPAPLFAPTGVDRLDAAPVLPPTPFESVELSWDERLSMKAPPGFRPKPNPSAAFSESFTHEMPSDMAPEPAPEIARLLALLEQHQREVATLHAEFLRTQTELHERFLASRANALATLVGAAQFPASRPPQTTPRAELPTSSPPPALVNEQKREASRAKLSRGEQSAASSEHRSKETTFTVLSSAKTKEEAPRPHRRRGLTPGTPSPPRGRTFSRDELMVHASGRISDIFGPRFAPQDEHPVQVRMPEPPLLLADRVTGLVGEPGSMKTGSVWTETDVRADSWYLQAGRMPAGLMIESGQADLFLISWLGADLVNRGDRRYRLLGCRLTWHRSPPGIGETLAYDIHVDGHAQQGEQRLFFFHYDCTIDGQPALTVRSGQAGFFTEEELAASAGVLWSPEDQKVDPDARVDPPLVKCERSSFDAEAVEALVRGDLASCFGDAFAAANAHVRTPNIGELRLIERVTDFDPKGGVHGRGYLRAATTIRPDDWFFQGHFKNDPCMPGTLMFEGCLSAMAFYLIGLGTTLERDGWRFEPIPDETYTMICRGQVLPTSRELVYEVFVEEVHTGPIPRLYADLLCTVDGLKAFHAGRVGLQLVPDWPLSSHTLPEGSPAAEFDGVRLDERALLASALGKPSDAFGPRYAVFDTLRRAPRLPGPPYSMVSRVKTLEGGPWSKKPGLSVEIEYDVPPDAWYFEDGASGAMPYALLLEAALQPCGWLATAAGCTLGREEDLRFRNLDGEGEVLGEVGPDAGTLRTRATLTSLTDTAAMIIVGFDVTTSVGETEVYRLKTVFGFFPDAAFRDQTGLPIDEHHRALFEARGGGIMRSSQLLPRGRLALLDEIPFFDPTGGAAGLGAARAEASVRPDAWFFKAHFYQDPVQPGSLGLEAMLSLLRAVMLEKGLGESLRAPRFTPIAGGVHRWKYRGQVLPTDRRIAITLELISIERSSHSVRATAEASLWVDGRRIYEASLGAERVEGAASVESAEPHEGGWPRDGTLDERAIARFWRSQLGLGESPVEDLYLGLLRRFVGRVNVSAPEALSAIEGPALYLANHQTAIETLMLSVLAGAASGVPLVTVAKAEHRESWLGRLLAWMFAHPAVRQPELTAYFDRNDPASLPELLRSIPRDRSLLIHVEGTRARSARHRIEGMSGVPLELAIERDLPIVPVRFTGGLPVEPVPQKLDFPVAMAAQDVWIGTPILPSELATLGYKQRIERVREAIESLGPREDTPNEGDLAFASEVARCMEGGLDLAHAVLASVLLEAESPSALTERMRAGLLDSDDPEERWAAELASRIGFLGNER